MGVIRIGETITGSKVHVARLGSDVALCGNSRLRRMVNVDTEDIDTEDMCGKCWEHPFVDGRRRAVV